MPSRELRPIVQIATGVAWLTHQCTSSTTSDATAGNTSSRTSFDCHMFFSGGTSVSYRCRIAFRLFARQVAAQSVYTGSRKNLLQSTEPEMNRPLMLFALSCAMVYPATATHAQPSARQLELERKGETIVLEPYAPNILRVTLSLH